MSSATDSMTQRTLTEKDVNERRDLSAKLVIDRAKKRKEKKATVAELNAQIVKYDEQIDKLAFEISERLSWVPTEPLFDAVPGYLGKVDGENVDGDDGDSDDDGDGDSSDGDDGDGDNGDGDASSASSDDAPPDHDAANGNGNTPRKKKAAKKKAGKKARKR